MDKAAGIQGTAVRQGSVRSEYGRGSKAAGGQVRERQWSKATGGQGAGRVVQHRCDDVPGGNRPDERRRRLHLHRGVVQHRIVQHQHGLRERAPAAPPAEAFVLGTRETRGRTTRKGTCLRHEKLPYHTKRHLS